MEITAEQVGAASQFVIALCVLWGLVISPYQEFKKQTQDGYRANEIIELVKAMKEQENAS